MNKVLFPSEMSVGTKVRVVEVDMFGFQGRTHHPHKRDVGYEGVIVGVIERPTQYEVDQADGEGYLCYRCCRLHDGAVLDLLDFEVVKVD